MLAAIDLDENSESRSARTVLRTARALAGWVSSPPAAVHVVHAWRLIGETVLECPTRGLGPGALRTSLGRAGRERRLRVATLVADVLGTAPEAIHVVHGSPRAVVPGVARGIAADVVVLGSRQTGALGRALLRGVAEAVADRTASDLMIVGGCVPWDAVPVTRSGRGLGSLGPLDTGPDARF